MRSAMSSGSFKLQIGSVALLLVLAASPGTAPSAHAQHASRARAKAPAKTVVIKAVAFQTPELTVRAGDVVAWKNEDSVEHTVTALDGSFNSGNIKPNGSWRLVAKKPGRYDYYCTLHPNMKATLIVTPKTGS